MEQFEDKYLDVLQNIEAGIVGVYRAHPEMTDWDALRAVEALIHTYQQKREFHPALKPLQEEVYVSVKSLCDWRLGKTELLDDKGNPMVLPVRPLERSEIIACLKRIRRSIENWNKRGGRNGYLEFVKQFIH